MPVCKNCEETFRTKKSLNAHLKECIEVSDVESESSCENEKKPRKIKKDEPLSQNVESNNDLVVIDEQNDDGDPKKEEAATDNTFSQSVSDVIDKKDIKRDFRCKKCQKIMVNEEHRLSHECQAKISELTGTLEERKQKLFKYYQEAFIKARNEIYDRIYPAFKYDAMVDLGISVSGLSELSRSKHANVEETKKTAYLDFERKHRIW
uniref:C2H2-type domain-containing protein n=1 Tax=Panagrolaimus superbus TaxID=310955 RepID=A0A914Z6G3_9BILA